MTISSRSEKYILIRNILLFIWFTVSNTIVFFLGMQYTEGPVTDQPREWVNITLRKSSVRIENSSANIDIWINGEKKKSGESFNLEEKK